MDLFKKIKVIQLNTSEEELSVYPLLMKNDFYGESLTEISDDRKKNYDFPDAYSGELKEGEYVSSKIHGVALPANEEVEIEVLSEEGVQYISKMESLIQKLTTDNANLQASVKELESKSSDSSSQGIGYDELKRYITNNFGSLMFNSAIKNVVSDSFNNLLESQGIEYKQETYSTNDENGKQVLRQRPVANVPTSSDLYSFLQKLTIEKGYGFSEAIEETYKKFVRVFQKENDKLLDISNEAKNGISIINSLNSEMYETHLTLALSNTLPKFCEENGMPEAFSKHCIDNLSPALIQIAYDKLAKQDDSNKHILKYIEKNIEENTDELSKQTAQLLPKSTDNEGDKLALN